MTDQRTPPLSALTRRTMLRMTAGAAGAAALHGLMAAAPAGAVVGGGSVSSAVAPDILTDHVFPIGFFWPPPRKQMTQFRYDQIANAGFTFVLGGNDVVNLEANKDMLRLAENAGLRALPIDDRITHAVPRPGWEEEQVRATLNQYLPFPAFSGFLVQDEPNPTLFPRLRMIVDVLTEAAPDKLPHLNLVPLYGPGEDAVYQEYLRRFQEQIDPDLVSFDHYPLLKDGTIRSTFFLNHRRIRESGLAAGLPTWVYVNTTEHHAMKQPNRAELAWQINIALAYGCKGIKYFTYWTPTERPDGTFGDALIRANGCPSATYGYAWEINRCHLQPVGQQLKHLLSKAVYHANEPTPPLGGDRFNPANSDVLSATSGSAVVVGEFASAPEDTSRWLFVANRSYTATANARLTVKPPVSSLEIFVGSSGQYQQQPLVVTSNGNAFDVTVPPGEGKLYRLGLTPPE